jgi:hypothetical protein
VKVSPIVTKNITNNGRVRGFGMAFALAQSLCLASSICSLSNSAAWAQDAYTPGHTSTGSSATAAGSQAPGAQLGSPSSAPLVRPVTAPGTSPSSSSPPVLRPPLPTLDNSLQPSDSLVDNGNLTAPIILRPITPRAYPLACTVSAPVMLLV